jgi:alpha 1,2-mannosyltransferase
MLWSRVHPITPLYAKEHANEEAVVESHRPDLGPLQEEYRQYFGSEHLPEILSQDPSTYKLSERLAGFLSRPVLSHEEAKESMRVHCPLEVSNRLVNPDQYNGDSEFWKNEVTKEVITEKRAKLVTWLAGKAEQGEKIVWENGLGAGRGIVMTAGNKVRSIVRF